MVWEVTIFELYEHMQLMKRYLQRCVDIEDFHGCMDAAADLREIQTEIRVRLEMKDGSEKTCGPA